MDEHIIMTYINKVKMVTVLFLVVTLLNQFGLRTTYAATGNVEDLMAQGTVKTCLRPQWNNGTETGGSMRVKTVHLTGRCESRSGCDCLLYQHPNGAVAADAEGGLDDAFCSETANLSDPKNAKKLAQILGVSTELLAKWSPPKPKSQAEIDERNKKLRNRCQKAIREANDPVLGSVPVGMRKCTIVRNNLAKANSQPGKNNVLGVTSDGKIPYGNVDIVVEEKTYKHSPIEFSAVGTNAPSTNGSSTENEAAGAGGDKSLKNGLLSFLAEEVTEVVSGIAKDCTSISWDPYGRVFDSQTLEPIPDVMVDLIDDATKQPVVMKSNLSYDVTGDDGLFNIQVEQEGRYGLQVDSLTGHQLIEDPTLNPLWKNIYSDLYFPGVTFIEKQSAPTHHDIPLEIGGEPFRGAEAKIVPGTLKSEDMNGIMVYTGRSTFPMALTCLVDEETEKTVGTCEHADNIGSFTIAVDKKEVPPRRLRVVVKKVDLTNPALYAEKKEVKTLHMNSLMLPKTQNPYYFEPVLSLVQGFTHDVVGNRIAGATVQVKLKANKQLYFETKADSLGFFTIYSSNLPSLEYYLEYVDPKSGKISTQSASEFARENKEYLETNKINLILAQKEDQPVQIKKTEGKMAYELEKPQSTPAPAGQAIEGGRNPGITILIVLLIVFLGVLVIGVVLFIKKQNTPVSQ